MLPRFSALEKLREEFRADNESLAQSEAISILSLCDDLPHDDESEQNRHHKASNGVGQETTVNGKQEVWRTRKVRANNCLNN